MFSNDYREKFKPKVIVLGVGYGTYSIDLEGYELLLLSMLTSGSKPVNLVRTNRLLPLINALKFLIYLPVFPTVYLIVAFLNLK